MKIYLVRHGEALAAADNPSYRPLSPHGLQQVNVLGHTLVAKGAKVATIYHSGILRAQQTAQLLGDYLTEAIVQPISGLKPDDPLASMVKLIDSWSQDTLLVGHLPYLRLLLQALVGGVIPWSFQPASAVCLTPQSSYWAIQWIFHYAAA